RPLLARVENGALVGDPVEIASGLAGHADCGQATSSALFTVRRRGAKPARAVLLSFVEGGVTFLMAAVSFAPLVLTWTDAKAPPGKRQISKRTDPGDTSFCVLQRDGRWSAVAYSAAAGDYAPAG